MTLRQARRRLGSRSTRRSGTNGKNIRFFTPRHKGDAPKPAPLGNSGRVVFKFLYPRPASRRVAVGVRRIMAGRKAS